MRKYVLPICLASLFLAGPLVARAADEKKPKQPTLVVRLASVEQVITGAKLLASLSDQEETLKQVEGLIKALSGPKGIAGIDTKKPLGIYGIVGKDLVDSRGVVMLPIAVEEDVLKLLTTVGFKPQKDKDDLYTIPKGDRLPVEVYFRFANGYAYVTALDPNAIAKDAVLKPGDVLPGGKDSFASLNLHIDQIDDTIKQLLLGQIDLRLEDIRDKNFSGETKLQGEFWKAAFAELSRRAKAVLKDGRELSLRLDINEEKSDIAVELSIDARPGSQLATDIAALAKQKSLFASLPAGNSAFRVHLNASLPEGLKKPFAAVVEESMEKGLEKELDKKRREQAAAFAKALLPTLTSGEFENVYDLQAPGKGSKLYTILAGQKAKDGQGIEKAARDLIKDLPPGDASRIKIDADKAGAVNVHRVDIGKDLPPQVVKLFDEQPLWVAVRPDALLFSFGGQGLDVMKSAIQAQGGSGGPVVEVTASLLRLAPLISQAQNDDKERAVKLADEVFAREKSDGRLRFAVEGGKSLSLRFSMQAPVVKFFTALAKPEEKKDK